MPFNKLKKFKGFTVDIAIRQAISDVLGISDDPNKSNESTTELVGMSDVKNVPDMSAKFNVITDKIDKVISHNKELENQNKEQSEFNKLLVEKLDQQERYIRESLERRDQALLESIRALQDEKKALVEVAAATASALKGEPKNKELVEILGVIQCLTFNKAYERRHRGNAQISRRSW